MKLLEKISSQYIVTSIVVMIAGIVGLYAILDQIASHEIMERLYSSRARIVKHVEQTGSYPDLYPFIEVKETHFLQPDQTHDTAIYDPVEGEDEMFKQLISYENINGKNYQITTRTMIMEKENIYMTIFLVVVAVFALLLISLYLLNKKTAANILKPFYKNLESISSFSLQDNKPVVLDESGITEFDELKDVLESLSRKVTDDYNNLKQFSENAAHELQTPLSVIRSKLEVLLNDNSLTREQSGLIKTVYQTVIRLSKLNHSLLLLTKIENRQYNAKQEVKPGEVILETLDEFEEVVSMKNISLTTRLDDGVTINTEPYIARIMIENLLSNAVKYSEEGGEIIIDLDKRALTISNTGREKLKNSNRIFGRFVKENPSAPSVGLGLAIVRKICDLNGYAVAYDFIEGKHTFRIDFFDGP